MPVTYKIGEAAAKLNLKTHVLRFWETEFPQIVPLRTEKGQRIYTEENLLLLQRIKHLLHEQGHTIEGAKKALAADAANGVLYASQGEPTLAAVSLSSYYQAPQNAGHGQGVDEDDEDLLDDEVYLVTAEQSAAPIQEDSFVFGVKPPLAKEIQQLLLRQPGAAPTPHIDFAAAPTAALQGVTSQPLLSSPSSLQAESPLHVHPATSAHVAASPAAPNATQAEALHILTSSIEAKHFTFYDEILDELDSIAAVLQQNKE